MGSVTVSKFAIDILQFFCTFTFVTGIVIAAAKFLI